MMAFERNNWSWIFETNGRQREGGRKGIGDGFWGGELNLHTWFGVSD